MSSEIELSQVEYWNLFSEIEDCLLQTAEQRTAAMRAELSALDRCSKLEAALRQSMIAIDDWLNIYAEEHCDPKRVAEAKARVYEGGTLYYIATVQEINRAALQPAEPHHDQ